MLWVITLQCAGFNGSEATRELGALLSTELCSRTDFRGGYLSSDFRARRPLRPAGAISDRTVCLSFR